MEGPQDPPADRGGPAGEGCATTARPPPGSSGPRRSSRRSRALGVSLMSLVELQQRRRELKQQLLDGLEELDWRSCVQESMKTSYCN